MPINAKDRRVLALAVHVEADSLITFDLGAFPTDACEPFGIEPMRPDEVLDASQRATRSRSLRRSARWPPAGADPLMTPAQLLDRFAGTIPNFVERCRPLL